MKCPLYAKCKNACCCCTSIADDDEDPQDVERVAKERCFEIKNGMSLSPFGETSSGVQ